jgi:hypothetical protein
VIQPEQKMTPRQIGAYCPADDPDFPGITTHSRSCPNRLAEEHYHQGDGKPGHRTAVPCCCSTPLAVLRPAGVACSVPTSKELLSAEVERRGREVDKATEHAQECRRQYQEALRSLESYARSYVEAHEKMIAMIRGHR